MNAYQTVPVTCPACQSRFVTPVLTIIDVGQMPQAKALFLAGQVNLAVCPQCGHTGMLSTPLVYHDPAKDLLLTYLPTGLGATDMEQQRIVGDLTNRVMSSLPVEQRRGYLLQPRSFFRLEAMIEAILEADGVTHEMLEAQRAQAHLLERLLTTEGADARRAIALENDPQIDYRFFRLVEANIEIAEASGRTHESGQLQELRQQLRAWTTQGKELAAREEAVQSLGPDVTRESLLQKLIEAALAGEKVKVETMVAVARPVIDYLFYQQLTSQIDVAGGRGEQEKARTLTALRETVLDLTAEIDAEIQRATNEAAGFLQRLLDSEDPEAQLRSSPDGVDELFLSLLTSRLQAARQAGDVVLAARLDRIQSIILDIIQEQQPPEVQLINKLLAADFPDGTRALLDEHRAELDSGFEQMLELVGENLARRDRKELAQRIGQIREQISSLSQGSILKGKE